MKGVQANGEVDEGELDDVVGCTCLDKVPLTVIFPLEACQSQASTRETICRTEQTREVCKRKGRFELHPYLISPSQFR